MDTSSGPAPFFMNSLPTPFWKHLCLGAGLLGAAWCPLAAATPATTPAEEVLVGGRFGRVVWVTNLQDDGPGSLRYALRTGGERTVLFRVGGEIHLSRPIEITHPQLTLAGQTAPGGIAIRGAGLRIQTSQVIITGLACGPGAEIVSCETFPTVAITAQPYTGTPRGLIPPVDRDFDGMPDAWERRYGLDPEEPADGIRDADGDGRTNLEAYLYDTTPHARPQ